SQPRRFLARPQLQQTGDRGLDEIDRIAAAVNLGKDVANPTHSEYVAHSRPGLHACTGAGGDKDYTAAAATTGDPVRNGIAAQRNPALALKRFLSVLGRLLHGGRHFIGFAVTAGYPPFVIADDNQCIEAEPPAALDHGGATANLHHAIFQAVLPDF